MKDHDNRTIFAGQFITTDTSPETDRQSDLLHWLKDYLESLSSACAGNEQTLTPANLQSLLDPAIAMADMALKARPIGGVK